MGFWQGMKRLLVGEPVFQTEMEQSANQSEQLEGIDTSSNKNAQFQTPVDSSGRKIIPEVTIEDVDCNRSGESMTVWMTFSNSSTELVFLDKINLLGQSKPLGFELSGSGTRRVEVYRGPLSTSNAYRSAELDYRLQSSGDYFRANYFVELNYDDGFYYPETLRLQRPVRDV